MPLEYTKNLGREKKKTLSPGRTTKIKRVSENLQAPEEYGRSRKKQNDVDYDDDCSEKSKKSKSVITKKKKKK